MTSVKHSNVRTCLGSDVQPVPQPYLIGHDMMCIVLYDQIISVRCRRLLEQSLCDIFYYVRFLPSMEDLWIYLDLEQPMVVEKLVFIVTGMEAKSYCKSLKKIEIEPKEPFVYEMQFGESSLKSDLPISEKFQCIKKLNATIVSNIKYYIETENKPPPEPFIERDVRERILPDSELTFGIHNKEQKSFSYLDRESLKFLLFRSFIKGLLLMENSDSKESIENMWRHCRERPEYNTNSESLKQINKLKKEYRPECAVKLYTKNSILFRTINAAFRWEDIDKIFTFHPFIKHIHQRLKELRQTQISSDDFKSELLFRGKKLPLSVLKKLQDNIQKLISINGFLSTTKCKNVATTFADQINKRDRYVSVLFEMHMNKDEQDNYPYADISEESYFPCEREVLFFMGFIWLVESVNFNSNEAIWEVKLKLCPDTENEHTCDKLSEEDSCINLTLGKILYELGEFENANKFYNRGLELEAESDTKLQAKLYYHKAHSYRALKFYKEAEDCINKVLSMQNNAAANHFGQPSVLPRLSKMSILTMKGVIYKEAMKYTKARNCFLEALMKDDGSSCDRAKLHYHFGDLCFNDGLYKEARDYYNKAIGFLDDDKILKAKIEQQLDLLKQLV